jgi:hypothetical protein
VSVRLPFFLEHFRNWHDAMLFMLRTRPRFAHERDRVATGSSRIAMPGLAAMLLIALAAGAAQDSNRFPDAPSPSCSAETEALLTVTNR